MASKKKATKERKLKSRRKRWSPGRVIRVSDVVYNKLNAERGELSWDCLLRRTLGLPDRYGTHCKLLEGMLEPTTGMLVLRINGASWSELEQTVRKITQTMRPDVTPPSLRPIRMREIP